MSERQHRTKMLCDTVFIGYTEDEVQSMVVELDKVKKIETQTAKHPRVVIRWNSLIDTVADADAALGFANYPRLELIG